MRSNKSLLFDVKRPTRIAYADKPLNLGGVFRYISVQEFERLLNIKYDENIYVDRSVQPTIQRPADQLSSLKGWYEGKEDVIELLKDPTKHLVICKMGKHGYGVFAAADLPKEKFISLYAGTLIHRQNTPKIGGDDVLAFQPELVIREGLQDNTPLMDPHTSTGYGFSLRNGRGIGSLFQHLPGERAFPLIEDFRNMLHARDGHWHDINYLKLNMELYSTEFVDPDMLRTLATQNIQIRPLIHNGYPVIGMQTVFPIKKGQLIGYSYPVPYWQRRDKLPEFFTQDGAPISTLFYKYSFGCIMFNGFRYIGDYQPLLLQANQARVNVRDIAGSNHEVDTNLVLKKLKAARALTTIVELIFPNSINIVDGNITLRTAAALDPEQQLYFYQLRFAVGEAIILKKAFQPIYDIPINWLRQVYEYEEGKNLEPLLSALKITKDELQTLFPTPEAPKLSA
jgi:hypothetical protein